MDLYHILKRPIITEKTEALQKENKYIFEVDKGANKSQIKQVVEQVFGVAVENVKTTMIHGKTYRFGKRRTKVGKRSSWKKAVVAVKEGEKIEWGGDKIKNEKLKTKNTD